MTVTFNRRKTDIVHVIDRKYFKFIMDEPVRVVSFIGAQPVGKIVCCYTSDKHNHPAAPHRRYVVVCGTGPKTSICDVSEEELESLLVFEDKESAVSIVGNITVRLYPTGAKLFYRQ